MVTILRCIRSNFHSWLLYTVAFVLLYHLCVVGAMVARFAELPNYVVFYRVLDNYAMIIAGTPDILDTLALLRQEPWLEIGYKNPDYYGIAQWSFLLLPFHLLVILVTGALLSTALVLVKVGRPYCSAKNRITAVGTAATGSLLMGVANATVTWVVCCASPSWVVMLAILGMSSSLALMLEPLGLLVIMFGFVFVFGTILREAKIIARHRIVR